MFCWLKRAVKSSTVSIRLTYLYFAFFLRSLHLLMIRLIRLTCLLVSIISSCFVTYQLIDLFTVKHAHS